MLRAQRQEGRSTNNRVISNLLGSNIYVPTGWIVHSLSFYWPPLLALHFFNFTNLAHTFSADFSLRALTLTSAYNLYVWRVYTICKQSLILHVLNTLGWKSKIFHSGAGVSWANSMPSCDLIRAPVISRAGEVRFTTVERYSATKTNYQPFRYHESQQHCPRYPKGSPTAIYSKTSTVNTFNAFNNQRS